VSNGSVNVEHPETRLETSDLHAATLALDASADAASTSGFVATRSDNSPLCVGSVYALPAVMT
jgi:hypothetical protein